MADRKKRVKALIGRNIADIVAFEIKKPSLGLVSVNEVEVYDDLSQANVYVTFLPAKGTKAKLEELQRTEGFVRSSLARKLDIYKVPRIRFLYDDSSSRAASLDEALKREEEQLSSLPDQDE